MNNNKVMYVINAASSEIKNHFEKDNVLYLNLYWQENDTQILFDDKDDTINKILLFIDSSQQNGESCLVHSLRG